MKIQVKNPNTRLSSLSPDCMRMFDEKGHRLDTSDMVDVDIKIHPGKKATAVITFVITEIGGIAPSD